MNKKRGFISRLIFSMLRDIPETRDNWMLLVKLIHDTEMSVQRIERTEYYDHFFGNRFTNVDSIKRIWALIQERNPSLRGLKWEERQKTASEVAKEIIEDKQLSFF